MNYQSLAPPITKANAAEYARRATIARERNRAARKEQILASPDHHARKEVEKQIQKVLKWMDKTEDKKEFARLCATLDRLWSKAYAEVRPTKRPIGRPAMPMFSPVRMVSEVAEPNQPSGQPPLPDPTPILPEPTPLRPPLPPSPQPPPAKAVATAVSPSLEELRRRLGVGSNVGVVMR